MEAKRLALDSLQAEIVARHEREAADERALDQELAKRELKETYRVGIVFAWAALAVMTCVAGFSIGTEGLTADSLMKVIYAGLTAGWVYGQRRAGLRARGEVSDERLNVPARPRVQVEGLRREELEQELADLEAAEAALRKQEEEAHDARFVRVATIEEKLARDALHTPADQDALAVIEKRQRTGTWSMAALAFLGVAMFGYRFFASGVWNPVGLALIPFAILMSVYLKKQTQKQLEQVKEQRRIKARVEVPEVGDVVHVEEPAVVDEDIELSASE